MQGGSVTEGFANDLPGNGTTTSKLDSSINIETFLRERAQYVVMESKEQKWYNKLCLCLMF